MADDDDDDNDDYIQKVKLVYIERKLESSGAK